MKHSVYFNQIEPTKPKEPCTFPIRLNVGERLVVVHYHYSDYDEPRGGTWFWAVTCDDPVQAIRDAAATFEGFEYGSANWGDAVLYLDLAALGIRDVTPIIEVYDLDHDEELSYTAHPRDVALLARLQREKSRHDST